MSATAIPAIPGAEAPPRREGGNLPFMAPAVGVLLVWMIVPLVLTLWFAFQRYLLQDPTVSGFAGLDNFTFLLEDPAFTSSIVTTLVLVMSVLLITVVGGTLLAVLFDSGFPGQGVARLLAIAPFFVMPTVSALVWKNLMMHPIYGVFGAVARFIGLEPVDWFTDHPLFSVILIVSWEWLPFALLILLTAVQSLDHEQREAARMDGAGPVAAFIFITLPHLRRAVSVVVMIETIFLLGIFAEIAVTTAGGPGVATTNLTYLIFIRALQQFDAGGASAGGVIAIILANIVAFFLVRSIGRRLEV